MVIEDQGLAAWLWRHSVCGEAALMAGVPMPLNNDGEPLSVRWLSMDRYDGGPLVELRCRLCGAGVQWSGRVPDGAVSPDACNVDGGEAGVYLWGRDDGGLAWVVEYPQHMAALAVAADPAAMVL